MLGDFDYAVIFFFFGLPGDLATIMMDKSNDRK